MLHILQAYSEPALAVLGAYLLFVAFRRVQQAYFSPPLSSIPTAGPLGLAKFTNKWSLWQLLHGRKFLAVHEAFQRLGSPLVRAGPSTVYISDYKLLSPVYQSKLDKASSILRGVRGSSTFPAAPKDLC